MMGKVAFCQLCRYGDVVLCLPMMLQKHREGHRVFCVVHKDFADILDAVSYVTPIVFDGPVRDVAGAAALAKRYADTVIVTQAPVLRCEMTDGTVRHADSGIPIKSKTFVERLWRAGGMWDRFHELPLVFDKRDPQRDAEVRGVMIPPEDGRPLLLVAAQGYSSYFSCSAIFRDWLKGAVASRWRVVDVSYDPVVGPIKGDPLPCKKVTDLLPLVEACDVLLTVNSLPLHLAYAFGTATIALESHHSPDSLEGDPAYWRAERRPHWVGRLSYQEAMTDDGKARILSILQGQWNG